MADQVVLWHQVESIKHRVHKILGDKVPHAFRTTPIYQSYTAMCGEAFWAHKNGELDEELVLMLHDAADKTIELWNAQRGTHAQSQTD
jgi:hypothetical protein